MSVVADIIMADVAASRPAASSSNDGYLYYETDTGLLKRSNGSTWVTISDTNATNYTDEKAQDAIGAMIADTDTVDLTYTDYPSELKADVKKQMSITSDASGLKLSGDSATPGNNKVYGTDGSGVKGWKADPSGGVADDLTTAETDTSKRLAPDGVGGVQWSTGGGGGITMDDADPYGIHHRLDTPDADDDEFDDASIDGAWTQVTPTGTATWVEANGVLSCAFNGQSANDLAAILKATTLADGEYFETCLRTLTKKLSNYTMVGIVITDGTSNTSNAFAVILYQTNVADEMNCELWTGTLTNMTTSTALFAFSTGEIAGRIRLRLKRNSSTSFAWLAADESGAQFNAFSATTANPGFTPTHAGVFVSVWGGSHAALAAFDNFRKI